MKKTILLFASICLLCLLSIISNAQAPNWSWAKRLGEKGSEQAISSTTDISGNLYLFGSYVDDSISFGDTVLYNNSTNHYGFIVKYSNTGKLIFAKNIETDFLKNSIGKIVTDKYNNVYISSSFYDPPLIFGTDTIKPVFAGLDIFVAKFDSIGNYKFAKCFGSYGTDFCSGLAVDNSCNIYIGGSFGGGILIFNKDTLRNSAQSSSYLVKIDSNGHEDWARGVNGNKNNSGGGVTVDNNGNIFFTGCYQSSTLNISGIKLTNEGGNLGINDIYLAKYSINGNIIWAENVGGASSELNPEIRTDNKNNLYLIGNSNSNIMYFDAISVSNNNWNYAFVSKFLNNGSFLWAKFIGGYSVTPTSIAFDTIGNSYLIGNFYNNIVDDGINLTGNSTTYSNVFIAKQDILGNALWLKKIEGKKDEKACDISVNNSGNIFITGVYTSDTLFIGSNTYINNGCYPTDTVCSDIFVACMIGSKISNNSPLCEDSELNLFSSSISGATYSWSGPNSFTSTDQNPVISNSTINMSGAYALHIVASGLPDIYDTTYVNIYPFPSAPQLSNTSPACFGSNVTLQANTITNAIYHWTGQNNLDTIYQNPSVLINSSGYYYASVNVNGCESHKDSTYVTIYSIPAAPVVTGKTPVCLNSVIKLLADSVTGGTFSWAGPNSFTSSVQNPVVSNNSTLAMSGWYYAKVKVNGCTGDSSIIYIAVNPPMAKPDICIVGVDTSNKNLVIWDKPVSALIDSFYIYRETDITNVYDKIGAVAYNSMSIFKDTASYPSIQSNKYEISILDSCGIESPLSDPHKTMHLSINQGMGTTWNLNWEQYEGITVSTYKIYRGTTPTNLQLIGSTSGSSSQYSDFSAPAGYVYYQVGVISPSPCSPSKTVINSSRSNIATNNPGIITGLIESNNEEINISPNPTTGNLTIDASASLNIPSKIEITNIQGQLIKSIAATGNKTIIDVSALPSGLYFVKVQTEKGEAVEKFIKL